MIAKGLRWALRRFGRRADERFLRAAMGGVDAVLASYPKSGRTWLRFALSCYFDRAAGLGLSPDLATTFRVLPNLDRDPLRGLPGFAFAGNAAVPLIPVSHRPFESALFQDRRLIFLVRDPRDVMVSAYFHATRHKGRYEGTIRAFIADERQGLANLLRYLNGWANGLAVHRHLIVSYEAMSADQARVIRAILSFLDLPCDSEAVDHAVAESRFDTMRRSERQSGIPGHSYDRSDGESLRMRRGKTGGFRDYLDDDDIAWIEARCAQGLNANARELLGACGLDMADRPVRDHPGARALTGRPAAPLAMRWR